MGKAKKKSYDVLSLLFPSSSGSSSSSSGSSGRRSKKVNVHGDGKANQNRSGGKSRGSRGSR